MSMEQAKSFLEKVKSDAALAEQVKDAKTADEVVKKAAELGYSFTQTEFETESQRVSDDELGSISGGDSGDTYIMCAANQSYKQFS